MLLQPSLLDRLTDDKPGDQKVEERSARGATQIDFRAAVLRDLVWLLNTVALQAVSDMSIYSEVKRSVMNFGIPDFTGATKSSFDKHEFTNLMREVIVNFEPRIIKESLKVTVVESKEPKFNKTILFDINGKLWFQPLPVELYLRSELDLELGEISVV